MKRIYNKIFWRSGLEVTPETFIQADRHYYYQQNLIRKAMNFPYYGLLLIDEEDKQEFSINADVDTQSVRIEQLCCRGTTKEGFFVDFDESALRIATKRNLSVSNLSSGKYYLVIRINPYEQVLIEPVENEETPLSHPAYEFDIKDLSQIKGNELPLLKMVSDGHTLQIDPHYIPPCMSVRSHKKLMEYYLSYKKMANEVVGLFNQKKTRFSNFVFPVSLLVYDIDQFSLSEPPYALVQQVRKLLKAFGFFVTELTSKIEQVLHIPYNHHDVDGLFGALSTCLQEVLFVVGKEEEVIEEDFTPKI